MSDRLVSALVLCALVATAGSARAQQLSNAIEYGMNPSFHSWAEREIVFADAMMRAPEFGYIENDHMTLGIASVIPLGHGFVGEGWPDPSMTPPGKKPATALFNVMEGTMPDGRVHPYVVTWKGTGSLSLIGPAVVGEDQRSSNRVRVYLDPTTAGGNPLVILRFDESHPTDPVRDVHVWLPQMEPLQPLFWPPYLARLKAMNRLEGPHTWRTLDWNRTNLYGAVGTNGAFEFDLEGMITPRSPSQGTKRGVCIEYQVALCNALGTNLHLTVPHRTDQMSVQDYVLYLWFTFLKVRHGSPAVPGVNGGRPFAGLDPELSVTIELSNEIWNPDFPVHHWMQAQADAKGITIHEQVASQLLLVFTVADAVFDPSAGPKARRFVGAHIASATWVRHVLDALPPGYRIDAAGPAAYFGPRRADILEWNQGWSAPGDPCTNCPTVQEVLDVSLESIDVLRGKLRTIRQRLDLYENPDGSHPRLELYESGVSFVWGQQPWAEAGAFVQTSPELYYLFVDHFIPMLVEERVDLVNWYCFMTDQNALGGWGDGPFGIWNDMQQELVFPVPDVYVDQGMPKAAAIYRGPPRVPAVD